MTIGKIIKNNGEFHRVSLSEEDLKKVLEDLRERNLQLFSECLSDAKELFGPQPRLLTPEEMKLVTKMATALFLKLGTSSITTLVNQLEEKVFYFKEHAKALLG